MKKEKEYKKMNRARLIVQHQPIQHVTRVPKGEEGNGKKI